MLVDLSVLACATIGGVTTRNVAIAESVKSFAACFPKSFSNQAHDYMLIARNTSVVLRETYWIYLTLYKGIFDHRSEPCKNCERCNDNDKHQRRRTVESS
jgi:hypothetical protein